MTREEAIEVLDMMWGNPLFSEDHRNALKIGVQAIKALQKAPKKGHWIHFARDDECSECGWSTGKYMDGTRYCPGCGAKMRE